MKNIKFLFVAVLLTAAASSSFAYDFQVMSNQDGLAACDIEGLGGQAGAYLLQCVPVGNGQNHGCDQIANTNMCQGWEGPNNGGGKDCVALCRIDPPQPATFVVRYYGQQTTRCDGPGGRRGARAVACNDVAHGKNHGCSLDFDSCTAHEGKGNGGNAACDAVCQ